MNRIICVILIIFSTKSAFSQSQSELNVIAGEEVKYSLHRMDSIFNKIVHLYSSDQLFLTNLRRSQKYWETYLASQVEAMYPDYRDDRYGSMMPVCSASYKRELVENRIAELSRWLTAREDGDCVSSIMYNDPERSKH